MNPSILIIGAGPSGLSALKALKDAGLKNIKAVEKNADVGGLWLGKKRNPLSPVYDSLNIITSKKLSSFSDFPMPDEWQEYIPHYKVWEYHKNYAEKFNLYEHIQFNTEVKSVRKMGPENFEVTYHTGEKESFNYVIVANGHHFRPNIPELPGKFEGELIHSQQYKNPLGWKDKSVLIVGAGNSGSDIAADTCKYASVTHMSLRRGYYIIPKFSFFGKPSDYIYEKLIAWQPDFIKKKMSEFTIRFFVGDQTKAGMPRPDHEIFETHPLVNSELMYFLKHNRIFIKPPIQKIVGKTVHFSDGTSREYDVLVLATGYQISFPFLEEDFVKTFYKEDGMYLYKLIFHPEHDDIFFVGLIQPDGNIWILTELQSKLIAKKLKGEYKLPANIKQLTSKEVKERNRSYIPSKRHLIEVNLYKYKKELKKLLKK